MKKILSAIIAAATLSTAVSAMAAPGLAPEGNKFYGGLQIGLESNRTKFSATVGGADLGKKTGSKVSMPLGAQVGWMYSMPDFWFAAVEGSFLYNFFGETKGDTKAVHSKLQKKWAFEVMPKAGYQFNEEIAAYLLCGISLTSFNLKIEGQTDTKKWLWGVAPGAGMMYKIDSQWSTSFEYKYQIHQKIEKKVGNYIGKAEPRAHLFTVKVNYAFA